MADPRTLRSDYMHFAKLSSGARYNLAGSGVMDCALDELGLTLDDLALHGPNPYGYPPLIEALAGRFSVDPACVVMPGGGCSFANHLALAALVAPGDEVLVETPTYELLISTLGYLQAEIRRFPRRLETGWRLDPDAVAERLTPRTRVVVVSDLHNPSGARAEPAAVQAVADAAAAVGATVLVDEVYLEMTFEEGQARTAFRPQGDIVVTSSLTKAYGLSGLRCGWILAPAAMAERMRRLDDLYAARAAHVTERMALAALRRLPALHERAQHLVETNRAAYREILGGHPALEQVVFDQGSTVFPRLRHGDGDRLLDRLTAHYDTSVAPGRFFDAPDHIRIGLGAATEPTRTGLERLAQVLES